MTSELDDWIRLARAKGASDLHLEPRLPVTVRVRGRLYAVAAAPSARELEAAAAKLLDEAERAELAERGSADLGRTIAGVRCRINVLRSARGVGLAVRLLPAEAPTLERLNLHPDLERLARAERGLVLVGGPTGSGKSSTLAALVTAIDAGEPRHVITIEEPIEYALRGRRSFLRQREVGRDTPSFAQALRDALREDPDVILVGELREREAVRLTLDAAETGHLVLATVHASEAVEAVQRVVAAFPAGEQESARAQLAGALRAVVCQRLVWRAEVGIRVPECEVLVGTHAVANLVRSGELFKLRAAIETGAGEGMWTYERWRRWLDERGEWSRPEGVEPNGLPVASAFEEAAEGEPVTAAELSASAAPPDADAESTDDDVIVLQPPEESVQEILDELDEL